MALSSSSDSALSRIPFNMLYNTVLDSVQVYILFVYSWLIAVADSIAFKNIADDKGTNMQIRKYVQKL